MSDIKPVAWHYTNNGGGSVWHTGPSRRLDEDLAAARDYPRVHKVVELYTVEALRQMRQDALEQAATMIENFDADDKAVTGRFVLSAAIRALKDVAP